MSIAAVQAFRKKVSADPDLQAEIKKMVIEQDWVDLGKAHGFIFSVDELQSVIDEINSNADADLSDYELSMVVAGSECHFPEGLTSVIRKHLG